MELKADRSDSRKIRIASICFMGLSHLIFLKDYVKGAFFFLVEAGFLALLPVTVQKIAGLITLGSPHPELPVKQRDNSVFMLIDGIIFIAIIVLFIVLYVMSVKSARKGYEEYCRTKRFKTSAESVNTALGQSFPVFGLTPGVLLVVVFVILPLVFSVAVAFTNYSAPAHLPANNTVDWVGMQNFKDLLGGGTNWSSGFVRVAVWTLVWAFFATVTCYFGGLIVAVQLKEINFHIAPVFRFIFILPYAVPGVVSMLVWKNLLNGSLGIINRTLMELNIIDSPIPWLGSPYLAQFMCILVNLWAGFGYFMLLSMGAMTAISPDMVEAARIDGANRRQIFSKITLPLVLYQTLPLIIMSFAHNVNNFGAIYFLTNGAPAVSDTTSTMAGGTDILVTWIYKLTMNMMKYNYASVIAIMIFIVLAPFAIFQFRKTRAYKEGTL
ncbi:MAG: sugar ABC transporter permease [Treponema sp.]|nr:sugar ABC transporter permease [Treponema sp.]